jgi:hypothetical protein
MERPPHDKMLRSTMEQLRAAHDNLLQAAADLVAVETPDADTIAEQILGQAYLISVLMIAAGR